MRRGPGAGILPDMAPCPECDGTLAAGLVLACPHCGRDLVEPGKTTIDLGSPSVIAGLETAALPPAPRGADPTGGPSELGVFRLIRQLGSGGMGSVYQAEDTATGRQVALKLLAPELAGSPEALERFRQEGRLASMIAHPRCVFVVGADETDGRPFILMELMPGKNLHDVVKEQGPLQARDAVAKTLDVIEGLTEAHRLGVVHRDVKPSNCFLDDEGRVKVGDFGLSKALADDADLTGSGRFLGTPHFASPEQVRADDLDQRTDVYSVAATLYFLLTGQPPIVGKNASATLARIASEPATPLRTHRPELPVALERAVMRGLERDRDARFQTLEELAAALRPLVPQTAAAGSIATRVAAYFIDAALFAPLGIVGELTGLRLLGFVAFDVLLWLAYMAVLEGTTGATLGKRLLRLRVGDSETLAPPGVGRALLRALIFYLVVSLPGGALNVALADAEPDATVLALPGLLALGLLIIGSTMRRRNGWRGLHELASGTRVTLVAPATRDELDAGGLADDEPREATDIAGRAIGPYRVREVIREDAGEALLLALEPALGRRVIIVRGAEPVPEVRRALARPTRPRWLASGDDDGPWEAFVAPAGVPLAELIARRGPRPWSEVAPLLEELAGELVAASADDTTPPVLSVDQVWVQPGGRLQLLDEPLRAPDEDPVARVVEDVDRRGLGLLYEVALLALTGLRDPPTGPTSRLRRPGRDTDELDERTGTRIAAAVMLVGIIVFQIWRSISHGRPSGIGFAASLFCIGKLVSVDRERRSILRAAREPLLATVPLHAAHILERLPGGIGTFERPEEVRAALAETRDRPATVGLRLRVGQLFIAGSVTAPMVALLVVFATGFQGWMDIDRLTDRVEDAGDVIALAEGRRLAVDAPDLDRIRRTREADVAALRDRIRGAGPTLESGFDEGFVLLRAELAIERPTDVELADLDDAQEALPFVLAHAHSPGVSHALARSTAVPWALLFLLPLLIGPAFWTLLTRVGPSYRLVGIEVVAPDGIPASRFRCIGRTLVAWFPALVMLQAGISLEALVPGQPWLPASFRYAGVTVGLLGLVVTALHLALVVRTPARSLADQVAGTELVPR